MLAITKSTCHQLQSISELYQSLPKEGQKKKAQSTNIKKLLGMSLNPPTTVKNSEVLYKIQ